MFVGTLGQLFVGRITRGRAALPSSAELTHILTQAVEAAQCTYEDFETDVEAFVMFIADKTNAGDGKLPEFVTDLYLTFACARGDERAIRRFECDYGDTIASAVKRLRLDSETLHEVVQVVRERLFVGPDRKIAAFRGAAPLKIWVRAVATRTAISMMRKQGREVPRDDLDVIGPTSDPALEHLKKTYRAEFRDAFARAFAELTPRQRNLLRQQLIDGVSVNGLAELYRVHRATVSRWLSAIRLTLLTSTRRILSDKLRVSSKELDSVIRLIESQMDASVERLLQSP